MSAIRIVKPALVGSSLGYESVSIDRGDSASAHHFVLINRGQGLHFQMRPYGIHIWVPDHIVDLGCAVFQR